MTPNNINIRGLRTLYCLHVRRGRIIMEQNDAKKYTRMLRKEFKETYGDLAEKVRKISDKEAEELSRRLNVPLEVAKVAIRLDLDGILDPESVCEILMREMKRLREVDFEVPQISSYLFNFAVKEGKWIEYLYTTFRKEAEEAVRNLANWERIVSDDETISDSSIINFLNERKKVIDGIIEPVMDEWLKTHEKANYLDATIALICALEKTNRKEALKLLEERKKVLQEFMSKIYERIKDVKGIRLFENIKSRVAVILDDLLKPVSELMKETYLELVLNSVPRPVPRKIQVSHYLFVGGPITRGGKVEPDLVKPTDFLERDILLARRRSGEDQAKFLMSSIEKVLKALLEQGMDYETAVMHVLSEMYKRFNVGELPEPELREEVKKLVTQSGEERIKVLSEFLFNHLVNKFVKS